LEVDGVIGDGCQEVLGQGDGERGVGREEGVEVDVRGEVFCRYSCFNEDWTCVVVCGHQEQLLCVTLGGDVRATCLRIVFREFAGLFVSSAFAGRKNIFWLPILFSMLTTDDDMQRYYNTQYSIPMR
jgi:hypothetical protein